MNKLTWVEIWEKKAGNHSAGDLSLSEIMRVNGYDVGYAATSETQMQAYVDGLIESLEIRAGDTLFEVGCGAGAVSIPMAERAIRVVGLDLSPSLIEIARVALPDHEFHVGDGAKFTHPRTDFDAALSQGVFQFFPSQDHGIETVRNMVAHTRKGGIVAVTDLLDVDSKEMLIKERIRIIGRERYERDYVGVGLEHQFYERAALECAVDGLCSECWFADQFLDNPTANYKFNFFARVK